MITELEQIIAGRKCSRCHGTRLYRLQDHRYNAHCSAKINVQRLHRDLQLVHYFSLEIPANKAAKDLHVSDHTVHQQYAKYRQEIGHFLEQESRPLSGEIECDESYFGGKQKGHRGNLVETDQTSCRQRQCFRYR